MSNFTSEAVQSLGGPSWLGARRLGFVEPFLESEAPSEQDENWRYGRIDDLDLARFSPLGAEEASTSVPPTPASASASAILDFLGERAALIRCLDGVVVEQQSALAKGSGIVISSAKDLQAPPEGFGAQIGQVSESFAAMAEAFVGDVVTVVVAPDSQLDAPIVVIHELSARSAEKAVFPRTFFSLGARAKASVVEVFVSGDEPCLVVPVTEIKLAEQAELAYHGVQQLGPNAWQLGYQLSEVDRGGLIRSFSAALGGNYSRLYTRSALIAEGAASELSAVYLATGSQVQDFRTFQEHVAARTKSKLVFKGAVGDVARSVYTGLIHMHKGARRAEASQTNRNLVLSEGAHADSVPNLDIEENDVRCSHASAVGPIDPEQRFYLESRGIPPLVAERLILLGFFQDLLATVPLAGCASYLSQAITTRLGEIGALAELERAS